MKIFPKLWVFLWPAFVVGQATADNSANSNNKTVSQISLKPLHSFTIDEEIAEGSGLEYWDGRLWIHNDSGSAAKLFALDTSSGRIISVYQFPGVKNGDWEDISQDSSYFYIGDFGNNRGKRKKVSILRVEKSSLTNSKPIIDSIVFSWPQHYPGHRKRNIPDCEAMVVIGDSIFVFTKEKNPRQTTVFSIPKTPGRFVVTYKDSFSTNILVTGATYTPQNKQLVLCGHTVLLKTFLLVFSGFKGTDFFSGKAVRVRVRKSFRQTEGVATTNGKDYFIINEYFRQPWILESKQELHRLDLSGL